MGKCLSIVIPTYNRRERLLIQLQSIFAQEASSQVEVVIVDNSSNYDIREAVIDAFGEVPESLRIERNRCNIGLGGNLAEIFNHCDTQWMWCLGDDDETDVNSIQLILDRIAEQPSVVGVLKFSEAQTNERRTENIDSLPAFWEYYDGADSQAAGLLIFLSNTVLNLHLLQPYLGKAFEYSYTAIAHLIPAFFMLDERAGQWQFCPEAIVRYKAPDPGQRWSFSRVALGLATAMDINFVSLKDRHYVEMCRVLLDIGHADFIYYLMLDTKERACSWRTRFLYDRIDKLKFRHDEPWVVNTLYRIAFYVELYSGRRLPLQNWFFSRMINWPMRFRAYIKRLRKRV